MIKISQLLTDIWIVNSPGGADVYIILYVQYKGSMEKCKLFAQIFEKHYYRAKVLYIRSFNELTFVIHKLSNIIQCYMHRWGLQRYNIVWELGVDAVRSL